MFNALDHQRALGICLNAMASLYMKLNDYSAAEQMYITAIQNAREQLDTAIEKRGTILRSRTSSLD
jgi:Tfp pilus assembly protein PilF